MAQIGLKLIELNKFKGHWRAKGFEAAGWDEPLRINRYDGYVTFLRKNWVWRDLKDNTIISHEILLVLLKKIT